MNDGAYVDGVVAVGDEPGLNLAPKGPIVLLNVATELATEKVGTRGHETGRVECSNEELGGINVAEALAILVIDSIGGTT